VDSGDKKLVAGGRGREGKEKRKRSNSAFKTRSLSKVQFFLFLAKFWDFKANSRRIK